MVVKERKFSAVSNHTTHVALAAMEVGADYGNRVLYLLGEINQESARRFIISLMGMDRHRGPIRVVLGSPGGDEGAGYAIFDAIRLAKNKIEIQAFGDAQSMGAIILQAGDRRVLSPECRVMIHNGSVNTGDGDGSVNADRLVQVSHEIVRSNKRGQNLLAKRTGISLAKIERYCKDEIVFYAEEAVKVGFADEVMKASKKTWKI